jgi:hypothetical protein
MGRQEYQHKQSEPIATHRLKENQRDYQEATRSNGKRGLTTSQELWHGIR